VAIVCRWWHDYGCNSFSMDGGVVVAADLGSMNSG